MKDNILLSYEQYCLLNKKKYGTSKNDEYKWEKKTFEIKNILISIEIPMMGKGNKLSGALSVTIK